MDNQHWATIWKILKEAYPESKPTGGQVEVYVRLLNDLPPEAILAAVAQHTASCKWFPKVSELRALAFTVSGSGVPTALDAWGEIQRAIDAVGVYGDPSKPVPAVRDKDGTLVIREWPGWSHPIIGRMVDALGWQTLCQSETEMADRAHFLKLYETLAERWRFEQQQLPEVKALRARMAREAIAAPSTHTAALPASQGQLSIASAIATLAVRVTGKAETKSEDDADRQARIEATRDRALAFLGRKAAPGAV